MPLTPATRLGPYEIIAPLGTEMSANAERPARFEREARMVAGLNHPNIVTLFSVEDFSGVRFLTMEMVDGRSLDHDWQAGWPLP